MPPRYDGQPQEGSSVVFRKSEFSLISVDLQPPRIERSYGCASVNSCEKSDIPRQKDDFLRPAESDPAFGSCDEREKKEDEQTSDYETPFLHLESPPQFQNSLNRFSHIFSFISKPFCSRMKIRSAPKAKAMCP